MTFVSYFKPKWQKRSLLGVVYITEDDEYESSGVYFTHSEAGVALQQIDEADGPWCTVCRRVKKWTRLAPGERLCAKHKGKGKYVKAWP